MTDPTAPQHFALTMCQHLQTYPVHNPTNGETVSYCVQCGTKVPPKPATAPAETQTLENGGLTQDDAWRIVFGVEKTEPAAAPEATAEPQHFSANHLGWDAIIKWAYANSNDGVVAVRDIAQEFVQWRTRANAAESENASLRAQLAEMTTDRTLWRDDHAGDCPYVEEVKTLRATLATQQIQIEELSAAISTPEVYAGIVSEIVEKDFAAQIKSLRAQLAQRDKDVAQARKYVWLRHGCRITALYGDDGEMQCGQCMIDFKREDLSAIFQKIHEKAMLAAQPAQEPQPQKEQL